MTDQLPDAENAKPRTLDDRVFQIGNLLKRLPPGPLAELRRTSLPGRLPLNFFSLAVACDLPRHEDAAWVQIVRIMAILTDKGRDDAKPSPHARRSEKSGWRGLGHALCDGGHQNWGQGSSDPRPVISQQRLSRLVNAPRARRGPMLERIARSLAATKPKGASVDCAAIARLILYDDVTRTVRDIARDYYDRLDRVTTSTESSETNRTENA